MNDELQCAIADLSDLREKLLAADVAACAGVPGLALLGRLHKIEEEQPGLILQYMHARTIVRRLEESEKLRELNLALGQK